MFALEHPRPRPDPQPERARLQYSAKIRTTTKELADRALALARALEEQCVFDGLVALALGMWGPDRRVETATDPRAPPFSLDRERQVVVVAHTPDIELASQRIILALAAAATKSVGSAAFVKMYLQIRDVATAALGWRVPDATSVRAIEDVAARHSKKDVEAVPSFEKMGRNADVTWGAWPRPERGVKETFAAAVAAPAEGTSERVWAIADPYRDNPYRAIQQQPGRQGDPATQFKTIWANGAGLENIGDVLPPEMRPTIARVAKPYTAVQGAGYGLPAPISSSAAAEYGNAPIFPPETQRTPMVLERPCSEAGGAYDACCAAKNHNGEYDAGCRPPVRVDWSELIGWPVDTAIQQIQRHEPSLRVEALVAGTANALPPDPRRVVVVYDAHTNRVVEAPRRQVILPMPQQDPAGLAQLIGQDLELALNYVKANYPTLAAVAWPDVTPLPTEGRAGRIILVHDRARKISRVPFFG